MSKNVGSVSIAVSEILKEFVKEKEDQFAAAADKVTKQAVKDIKAGAPKNTGEYRKGWRRRKLSKTNYIVYNEKRPNLTHLLEKGHVIKNQNGTYGRAPAHKHIGPAEEKAVAQLIKDCSQPVDTGREEYNVKL